MMRKKRFYFLTPNGSNRRHTAHDNTNNCISNTLFIKQRFVIRVIKYAVMIHIVEGSRAYGKSRFGQI